MTITQADRDAAQPFMGDAVHYGHLDEHTLVQAFAKHREAAEARAREEGAKAMHIELAKAANACMNEYKRGHADGLRDAERLLRERADACSLVGDKRHILFAAADAIAALDPAQIAGGKP